MPMRSISRWGVRVLACGVGAYALYTIVCLTLFLVSMIALGQGRLFSNRVMQDYQKFLYLSGARKIWQTAPGCTEFDADLLYKPKLGECKFDNVEFSSILHFDENGRVSAQRPHSRVPGVAVLGDSHAMGWGVNDDETFSVVLERMTGRPVYNLAVASYGTYRELLRMQKSGLLNQVDTIVIQYCRNDLEENVEKIKNPAPPTEARYQAMFEGTRPSTLSTLGAWVREANSAPFRIVQPLFVRKEFDKSFGIHLEAIRPVFAAFPWLQNKRVIVFYSNGHGGRFRDVEATTRTLNTERLRFVDLDIPPELFRPVDGHPTPAGHRFIAERLAPLLNGS